MKKLNDIKIALEKFEEAATKHAEAIERGDYKTVNKNYDAVIKAISYLKEHNCIAELLQYLDSENVGVRLAAATYLLHTEEREAIRALEEIAKGSGIRSLAAETTLSEWRKGNLKL